MSLIKKNLLILVTLGLCFLLMMGFLYAKLGYSLLSSSPYNTYTLQALAWRQGQAYLNEDVPHLELAVYQGRYFVSFPPIPGIPVFLLTYLFDEQVPDGLLILTYAFLSLLILWRLLGRNGFPPSTAAIWAFLICFASSMLPLTLNGAVWYQAQVLGFLLILAAIERYDAQSPTLSLIFFALSVGCRPINVLYGPLLIIGFLLKNMKNGKQSKSSIIKLLPGIISGLLIAGLYGVYNYIRFDNFLEFGHNYLPEFSFQGGTQFSLDHLGKNIIQYVFALPFEQTADGLSLKAFGFSLFLANPILLMMLFWSAVRFFRGSIKKYQSLILSFFVLHLLALLLHRTFGGYQYGARYAVDLIPYAVLLLMYREKKTIHIAEAGVMLLGLALSIYGSLVIHL